MATYSAESYQLQYVRDDIRQWYAEATIRMAVDELAECEHVPDTLRHSFTHQYASLRLFPDVCMTHLTDNGGQRGAIISLESAAGANLVEFVEDCADRWKPAGS